MFRQQFSQSNVASVRLAKLALLVVEAAIVTVSVTVFTPTDKAYASDDSVRFTPIPSLQEMLQARGTLGSAKALGTVAIPLYDSRRPCYTNEPPIYCHRGDSDSLLFQTSESINSTRIRSFKSEPSLSQIHLFEVPF